MKLLNVITIYFGVMGEGEQDRLVHQFAFSYTWFGFSLVMNMIDHFFICSFHTYSKQDNSPLAYEVNGRVALSSVSSQAGETEGVAR